MDPKYTSNALKTIPPSSIELERTFSVTGFYITQFRCSLGSINALVFLKHVLKKEDQEEKDRVEKERLERRELLNQ